MHHQDQTEALVDAVRDADRRGDPLRIIGTGSKAFLSGPGAEAAERDGGRWLCTAEHQGIIDYRPEELVVTVRAGTPLAELERVLAEHDQILPFEPPRLRGGGSVGGAVATGLSGPSRPWRGAVRDSVLGVELVNGCGEQLRFGGQVMKNVAGYDVSRLQVGAFGTLGLLLSVSIKLLPRPAAERTRVFELPAAEALDRVRAWARTPWPITATAMVDGRLWVRLSGAAAAVADAVAHLGGEPCADAAWWTPLRDHRHGFYDGSGDRVLWRMVVPAATPLANKALLVTWAGAERWAWRDPEDTEATREAAAQGGHARPFDSRYGLRDGTRLGAAERRLASRLREAFDPGRLFNRHLSATGDAGAH